MTTTMMTRGGEAKTLTNSAHVQCGVRMGEVAVARITRGSLICKSYRVLWSVGEGSGLRGVEWKTWRATFKTKEEAAEFAAKKLPEVVRWVEAA
jgi:hypothetical protein